MKLNKVAHARKDPGNEEARDALVEAISNCPL